MLAACLFAMITGSGAPEAEARESSPAEVMGAGVPRLDALLDGREPVRDAAVGPSEARQLLDQGHQIFAAGWVDAARQIYLRVLGDFVGTGAAIEAGRFIKALDYVPLVKRRPEITSAPDRDDSVQEPIDALTRTGAPTTEPDEADVRQTRSNELLEEAHALLDADDLAEAHQAYLRVFLGFPNTPAAAVALRMLTAIEHVPLARRHTRESRPGRIDELIAEDPALAPEKPVASLHRFAHYSPVTGEERRLHGLEVADFLITAWIYGTTTGVALGLISSPMDRGEITLGTTIGGMVLYPLLASLYAWRGRPDRGDLPLMLSTMLYIPTTALLITAMANATGEQIAGAVAVSSLGALIPAFLLGRYTDVDPGDMQLIRETGFWIGGVTAGITAAISHNVPHQVCTWPPICHQTYNSVDHRLVAGTSLVGLFAGLGIGIVAAGYTELSYWRVRLITLTGYAGTALGAVLAGFIATEVKPEPPLIYAAMVVGGVAGLLTGYFASGFLDERLDADALDLDALSFLTPTLLPPTAPGRNPALGLNLVQGRF